MSNTDELANRTYPYAYGYCLGYVSLLVDESERIMLDSQTISKPAELRERINKLHALIRNTHNKLNRIKVN